MPKGSKRPRRFNPEGSGYDYQGARAAGLAPDKTGHWPSRDPRTGLIFKGAKHKTFSKTRGAETRMGNEIKKRRDGRYYSNPGKR